MFTTAVQAHIKKMLRMVSHGRNSARGVRYLFRVNMSRFLTQGDQVYLFLAFTY